MKRLAYFPYFARFHGPMACAEFHSWYLRGKLHTVTVVLMNSWQHYGRIYCVEGEFQELIFKSEGTRMVYCRRGEGCGQERARESKDDRLGSSSGSLQVLFGGVLVTNIEKYVLCSCVRGVLPLVEYPPETRTFWIDATSLFLQHIQIRE